MSVLQWGALGVLVLLYGGSGAVELPRWRKAVDQYVKWHYPRWWAILTPALKILAAALIVMPQTRWFGVALCVVIALTACATVLWFKDRLMYTAALSVTALTWIAAGLLLF